MISPKVAALLERIPERAVRSASGKSFGPITITATMTMSSNSVGPISNMGGTRY